MWDSDEPFGKPIGSVKTRAGLTLTGYRRELERTPFVVGVSGESRPSYVIQMSSDELNQLISLLRKLSREG